MEQRGVNGKKPPSPSRFVAFFWVFCGCGTVFALLRQVGRRPKKTDIKSGSLNLFFQSKTASNFVRYGAAGELGGNRSSEPCEVVERNTFGRAWSEPERVARM